MGTVLVTSFTYKSTISTSDEDQDCRLKYAKKAGPFLTPPFISFISFI